MSAVPDDGVPTLNCAQVESLLERLSTADWRRAELIAARFCSGLNGWTPMDLLQEAMAKFLEGARKWPADLHPLVVLKTAMHSIASNARKHNAGSPVDDEVLLDPLTHTFDDIAPAAHGKITLTPEDAFSGKQEIIAIYASVRGNDELESLVIVWADGLRGEEAMRELGWDRNKYDAARKRLTRKLDVVSPDRRDK